MTFKKLSKLKLSKFIRTNPFLSKILAHSSSDVTSVCRAAGAFFFVIFRDLSRKAPFRMKFENMD